MEKKNNIYIYIYIKTYKYKGKENNMGRFNKN